jgi:hypothetical protein
LRIALRVRRPQLHLRLPAFPRLARRAAAAAAEDGALVTAEVRIRGHRGPAEIALSRDALRIRAGTERTVAWSEIDEVDAHRGRVRIGSGKTRIELALIVEGVDEPLLSQPFVEVVRDAKEGRLDLHGTSLTQLQNAADRVRERFLENDDAVVPMTLIIVAFAATAILMWALPELFFYFLRPTLARDAFLLSSRVGPFDPRVLAAAVSGAAATAAIAALGVMGSSAGPWARGTLRGWHAHASPLAVRLRRALALVVLAPAIPTVVFVVAIALTVPTARQMATVDPRGIHAFGSFPVLDRETGWSDVSEVVRIPASGDAHPQGYAVAIRRGDATLVSTADLRLENGSDGYFDDMIARWRKAAAR